ncbi:hypothetical protein OG592_16390 [Streptomyces avidinii]|uniref:hypothetical protein n=1 Tax=Streptomyces avidinii TaxID=1895 RepID=UPI00386DC2E8|nr:hypothetical protein OG592_16390 [Streptomyces avidinii]
MRRRWSAVVNVIRTGVGLTPAHGGAPTVSGVTLASWNTHAEAAGTGAAGTGAAATAGAAHRLYATREGLVGGTTANGHVVRPWIRLPLASRGVGHDSGSCLKDDAPGGVRTPC